MTSLSLQLALILFACARAVTVPGSLPDGAACITTERTGKNDRCMDGLACVINNFGMPKHDIENGGVCRALPKKTPPCSLDYCSVAGYQSLCRLPSADCHEWAPAAGCAVLCGAWAGRRDGGRKPACPVCPVSPPGKCSTSGPLASDGKRKCNLCALRAESCRSNFRIRGPVQQTPEVWRSLDAGVAAAAAAAPRACSASGKAGMCLPGELCLIDKFMMDDSTGTCKPEAELVMCGVDYCTQNGSGAWCSTPFSAFATTCAAWAAREDYGRKASCSRSCPRNCDPPAEQVRDNMGTAYCSACALRKASCEANFSLYGKIPVKMSPENYICSTKNPSFGVRGCQKGLHCVLDFFGDPVGGFGNSGRCKPMPPGTGVCSTAFCRGKPPLTMCKTSDSKDITNCHGFGTRSDV